MKCQYLTLVFAFWLILLSVLPNSVQEWGLETDEMSLWSYNSQRELWGHEESGPWVDTIVVESYETEREMILALIDGDIDACADSVSLDYLDQLDDAEDVELTRMPKNGYGFLNINCEKYPLNITEFRRSLAHALNKESLCENILVGLAQPHDSCIPTVNHMSNENQMNGLYYAADLEQAVELLDVAGFVDIDSDGYRETPNGSDLEISVYDCFQEEHSHEVCLNVVDTLHSMSIRAELVELPQDLGRGFQFSEDYDISFNVRNFNNFALDELFTEYLSKNLDDPYRNLPRFVNSTYDAIASRLIHSTSYDEIEVASSALQKIILHECPIIVCYETLEVYAYRTDDFCYDCDYVAADFWRTCYKAYRKVGDVIGGTFTWGTTNHFVTFNPGAANNIDWNILSISYDSLFRVRADGRLIPRIAWDYEIETNLDTSDVPLGHCRYHIRIPKVWDWNGIRLTAEDVAQALEYYREYDLGWLSKGTEYLTAVYSLNSVELVLEFNKESFWFLHNVCTKPILPIYYFEETGIINQDDMDLHQWYSDEIPSLGSFFLDGYVEDDFIVFDKKGDSILSPSLLYAHDFRWKLELPDDGRYCVIYPSDYYHFQDTQVFNVNSGEFTMEYSFFLNDTILVGPCPTHWLNASITSDTAYPTYRPVLRIGNLSTGTHEITIEAFDQFHEMHSSKVIVEVISEEELFSRSLSSMLPIIILVIVLASLIFSIGVIVIIRLRKSRTSRKLIPTYGFD